MLTSDRRLQQILADRIHGSRTITRGIINVLLEDLSGAPVDRDSFTALAGLITSRVPSFALVFDLMHTVGCAAFDTADSVSAAEFREHVAVWQRRWEAARRTMSERGRTLLSGVRRVATYSSSGAVFDLIHDAHISRIRLMVVGSMAEPGREGELFLRDIEALGIATELVADADLSQRVASCDLVLLGADAVFPDRFWNKAGSTELCRAASDAHVPVYVAAEAQKWAPSSWGLHIAASGSPLFEPVPLQLAAAVISDRDSCTFDAIGSAIATKRTCRHLVSSPK